MRAPPRAPGKCAWSGSTTLTLGMLPVLALFLIQVSTFTHAATERPPRDLVSLMDALRQVRQVDADYTEIVESDLLTTFISTRGRLVYTAPDRIRKTGEGGEEVEIVGERLTVRQGGSERALSIRDYAPLERLVVALRASLAGDLERLQSDYHLDFRAWDGGWTLGLRPRERTAGAAFKRIELAGRGTLIDRMMIEESGGDRRTLNLQVRSLRPAMTP